MYRTLTESGTLDYKTSTQEINELLGIQPMYGPYGIRNMVERLINRITFVVEFLKKQTSTLVSQLISNPDY